MIKINSIKIRVYTEKGEFGIEEHFNDKINFIASYENTKGKSSCIEAMYYCLGLEELIGGVNEQALKPVFRKELEHNNQKLAVLESEFYLEIENTQKKIITLKRIAQRDGAKSKLISIYFGTLSEALNGKVQYEDTYVHSPGSATNEKGFHKVLEEFIGWNLPLVPTYDDVDRKLYIQTIFSAAFIEQKRGWSDILATLPTKFKIKEASKRVIEFILNLETLETEKQKQECKSSEKRIKLNWEDTIKDIKIKLFNNNCAVFGLPSIPQILDEHFSKNILIVKKIKENDDIPLEKYIERCKLKLSEMNSEGQILVSEKADDLEVELSYKNDEVSIMEQKLIEERQKLNAENEVIDSLKERLHIIKKDLTNNNDALKIKKLGSTQGWEVNKDICPTCHQSINDSLLPQDINYSIMTIEENIKHLQAQKEMLEFTIENHIAVIEEIKLNIVNIEAKLFTERKFIRSIKNDLYSKESNISETIIRRKISLENEIENLNELKELIMDKLKKFAGLSVEWKQLQEKQSKLPSDKFTELDKRKIAALKQIFKNNLADYGFSSTNPSEVDISEEKYLPVIQGFDMKFDSSASDSIRAIWAFTVALLQTSNLLGGNHPNILIFDEPDQQSTTNQHLGTFLNSLVNIKPRSQVFIGITLKDDNIIKLVKGISHTGFKLIEFENKAIAPIKQGL